MAAVPREGTYPDVLKTVYEKRLLCDGREHLAYTYKKSLQCNELNRGHQ